MITDARHPASVALIVDHGRIHFDGPGRRGHRTAPGVELAVLLKGRHGRDDRVHRIGAASNQMGPTGIDGRLHSGLEATGEF
jgi:hypothetical protein